MANVALYSINPILCAGFETIVATLDGFTMSGICADVTDLMDHVQTARPDLLLLDVTSEITLSVLKQLKSIVRQTAIILWVDTVSTEFVSQALSLGIRGVLHKTLPIPLQVKCLQKVVGGELWLDKALSEKVLCSKRVALTPRERDLMYLLSQGRKNKEIAYLLGLTEGSVKVYLSNLFQKVGANDRLELALYALKNLGMNQPQATKPRGPIDLQERRNPIPEFLPDFISMGQPPVGLR